ncbi:MAG: cobaltochelatase subunit CobN [Immundisolibacterales bacterium]|nr:cobaltochelatase subunit CobN [Immundisolibacterales bacterium]
MHLLRAKAGSAVDETEAVDLGQTPGDIVFLSAADTELASLAAARAGLDGELPSLRLANLMQLAHPMSVDLYVESVVARAKLVVARVLGGAGYWPYGVEQIVDACRDASIPLALLPGDDQPDPELAGLGSVSAADTHRLWQYCVHGGPANARSLLAFAAELIGVPGEWREPAPLPRAGVYYPDSGTCGRDEVRTRWTEGAPCAAIVFYRAHVQAANLAPIDALVAGLREHGVNALPLFVSSLKDPVSADLVASLLEHARVRLVLNATGFAVSSPGAPERRQTPFDANGRPVLQVVLAGGREEDWENGTQGLSARDIAMNVALPEVDGRIVARAVSFKAEARFDAATECPIVAYVPRADRIAFTARLARAWIDLGATPARERRVAIVLANYPNRDGRLGNGVGLDTPAGTVELLRALAAAGYRVENVPARGNALIEALAAGPTNAAVAGREIRERLFLDDYHAFFATLPAAVRGAVVARWGQPEADPFYLAAGAAADATGGGSGGAAFAVPALRFGNVTVALQPARGYHIDPAATYHDPDLVPPHGYFAFYAWLRSRVHAIVHMGKHGNLEWLPGKALALSAECYPEAALGPLPHVYPFIVNDPGEGTQAKRRAQAVIVDHLTPPLTRAESYGPLADLERLVDEYYEASGVDPRRLAVLRDEILELVARLGLDRDCGITPGEEAGEALTKLDAYLCELKEMQIRDGLHVFGCRPDPERMLDLLVALVRVPRGEDAGPSASITRALARDLGLDGQGFDPLDCDLGARWNGARPAPLADALDGSAGPWRTAGDTVERLEALARALVGASRACPDAWSRTRAVLREVDERIRPAVEACAQAEIRGVLTALDGRFLEPGPSGAPTRGRPDVLPTGRNFYSVDTRTVPTPVAWRLGWQSAALLVERHRQEQGEWPRRMALSAWGTSNMRTGGDDIAQGLALMGVRPTWEPSSGRVTGFEVLPLDLLDRPRVDVTLRVSGFFRDSFPAQIALFDAAARAVARLEEPVRGNPLASAYAADVARLAADGVARQDAERRAGYRVFGSKPGAYGAGLQALIDERGWREEADLARAWIVWGGHAYGAEGDGSAEHALFETRLRGVEAVVHNQDNREHDLLDSDDYYQFEGGMTAAVHHLSGTRPAVWHNDHSRPESPRIRRLEEEIARVVRARVVNPKWIRGVMRHGYKGAFEMAATVDYLFAFAATARAVGDHHFDAVFEAYVEDRDVRAFFDENNPAALREIAERLGEAVERGLWRPRSNSAHVVLGELAGR